MMIQGCGNNKPDISSLDGQNENEGLPEQIASLQNVRDGTFLSMRDNGNSVIILVRLIQTISIQQIGLLTEWTTIFSCEIQFSLSSVSDLKIHPQEQVGGQNQYHAQI